MLLSARKQKVDGVLGATEADEKMVYAIGPPGRLVFEGAPYYSRIPFINIGCALQYQVGEDAYLMIVMEVQACSCSRTD